MKKTKKDARQLKAYNRAKTQRAQLASEMESKGKRWYWGSGWVDISTLKKRGMK